jgi:lysophospholipase L1-like esterase
MRLSAAIILVSTLGVVLPAPAGADVARVGYPDSMASTGDSITRAFNTGPIPFIDAPGNSWSTGSRPSVASHYVRILSAHPQIAGRAFNDARSGARMRDLAGQAAVAVAQDVDYVTVLMGANDVCRSSESAMTAVADFRAQLESAMATLSAGLPDARIYVTSIPDVYRLWFVLKGSFWARLTWQTFGICQSMLANPLSTAQADVDRRARVRARNIAFNNELAAVCARYIHCRYDGGAVFATQFVPSDVSTRDYFHPSLQGQTRLASISWAAGFDFTDSSPPMSSAQTTAVNGTTTVTISASDNAGLAGIEYRLPSGSFTRYSGAFTVSTGTAVTYRAVDVNGNVEATHTVTA